MGLIAIQIMNRTFQNFGKITYEREKSKNQPAFKHYNADELIEGITMRDHLSFAMVYWHTFRGTGSDSFGAGTMQQPLDV